MASQGVRAFTAIAIALLFAPPVRSDPHNDRPLPIKVAPGATFVLDRIPANGRDVFALTAGAGQTLLLELNACCEKCVKTEFDKADDLRVIFAGIEQPESISSDLPPDDLPWYWMGALRRNGIYHLVVNRPSRKRYTLRVTLMDAHDPRLDPGISAARVSMNEGLLPRGQGLALEKFEPPSFCEIDDNWPAHLSAQGKGFGIEIMSLDGLKKAWWGDARGLAEITRLELALRQRRKPTKPPMSAFQDAALVYWGKMEFLHGQSWRGLRWIAQYAQDYGPLANPLQYMVEAISNDGRYFILIYLDVDYLDAPRDLSHLSDEQVADLDTPTLFQTFQMKVRTVLTGASQESFKPNLSQLDAAVRSLGFH
jgi:hypothetical protein